MERRVCHGVVDRAGGEGGVREGADRGIGEEVGALALE